MKETVAILLAAGASERTPVPKQLYRVGGVPLVQHQVDRLLANGLKRVCVVLGHHAERVSSALAPSPKVVTVLNPAYEAGMFASVLRGIVACGEAGALFIQPVDVPVPSRDVFTALLEAPSPIAIPVYRGGKGHPLRLDASAAEALLHAETGRLDRWLHGRKAETSLVEVADGRVVMNANTTEALEKCFGKDVL